ncbi:MAG TPA: CHASE domain-containing protein, partial [Polyangiaceae bacterium]
MRAGLFRTRALSLAFAVLALGIALTILSRSLVQERALRTEQVRFERRAAQLTHALRSAFEVPTEVLHSIPSLFDASESVERHEFRTFVRRPLERWPEIYALEWFPRVSGSERSKYESAARSDGLTDFQFTRTGEGGRMLRAEPRSEHFPLYFMEPSNAIALGFDLASEEARVAPVLKARDSGRPVMSPRIRLVEDAPTVFSIAAFSPVYAGGTTPNSLETRRLAFRGVAAVVFRIEPVVDRVLRDGDLGGSDFVLRDRDAPPGLALLHETRPGLGHDFSTEAASALVAL